MSCLRVCGRGQQGDIENQQRGTRGLGARCCSSFAMVSSVACLAIFVSGVALGLIQGKMAFTIVCSVGSILSLYGVHQTRQFQHMSHWSELIEETEAEIERLRGENDRLEGSLDQLGNSLGDLGGIVEGISGAGEDATDNAEKIRTATTKIQELSNTYNQLIVQYQRDQNSLSAMQTNLTFLSNRFGDENGTYAAGAQKLNTARDALQERNEAISTMGTQLNAMLEKVNEAFDKAPEGMEGLEELRRKMEGVEGRIAASNERANEIQSKWNALLGTLTGLTDRLVQALEN